MQIKCAYCATPFALDKDQIAEAIEVIKKDPRAHYNAHCPKCRRVVRVPRKNFEINPLYKKMLES